jgi:hypothetical protein
MIHIVNSISPLELIPAIPIETFTENIRPPKAPLIITNVYNTGSVRSEIIDPRASADLYRGLHFPASE